MRIISGKFKGHQLVSFSADHIRPTTDRVKETIFNKLMFHVEDARVLDLFSGTGNLGLEAVSRGAKDVVCVEKSRKSIEIIQKNIQKLKVATGIRIINQDVLDFLKLPQDEPFDLVLIDPPFTEKMADEVMEALSRNSNLVRNEGLVVLESSSFETLKERYPGYNLLGRKDFGDKVVSFFERGDHE